MGSSDLWSKIKGTFRIDTNGPGTPKRFRLTNKEYPPDSANWVPWDAVAIDNQHLSGAVYVAFNGTEATSTLATAVYDETRTTFRLYPRTRTLFAVAATSVSIITSGTDANGTTIYADVYRY